MTESIEEVRKPGGAQETIETKRIVVQEFVSETPVSNRDLNKKLVDQNIGEGYGNEFKVKATDLDKDYAKNHFIDLRKPMLPQILFNSNLTKEVYLDQVHRPRHYRGSGSAPLFGNFLEPLSKTAWYVIPLVWGPCVAFGIHYASQGMAKPALIASVCFGLFLWTLIEYLMHRFLFHLDEYTPDHPVFLTMHFLFHGVHHFLPADRYRLVMPPALFVILATPWFRLALALFPYYMAVAVFSGGVMGYIFYDLTHYFLHHRRMPGTYLKRLKTWHLDHHYKNYKSGFGVTSWFWDTVFHTEGPSFAKFAKTGKAVSN
ncbi:sphingosine hydroxylase [Schizosaccharomyces japonicus yFS275]|uniref:Sphingosine hydroxylase n=1 Tax=Schizosaccharomyces japonicus (strain yFS275 / FY16936) TaxID=402676 RepID=B6K837_SCHJY|nr:sphingosine hydroxylase [Schizosaccharomyces japonicus yFS275]EEB09691.2 sphingosine hydroxylase [Schizosaccharomyces japonicus yFS275]